VRHIREWLFTPLARFASFEALNEWLATRCRELAARKRPATPEQSIAACFITEQLALRPITAPFDGYVEHMLRVSSTCLVVLDRNRYSVPAAFAGRAVSVRSTASEIRVVADGAVIAEHARRFGRDQLICDPWHYLPILERKPGALRNGVPFQEWARLAKVSPAQLVECQTRDCRPPFSWCGIISSSSPRAIEPSSSC
jgi:hypothetical protein